MRFVSTRGGAAPVTLSDAILQGLASDGGLFVPDRMPVLPLSNFSAGAALPSIAERLLAPFAEGDALAGELGAVCAEAFDFPAPIRRLERARGPSTPLRTGPSTPLRTGPSTPLRTGPSTPLRTGRPGVLELFHGPTCAFKDFGARFTAAALERVHRSRGQKVTILVATSGDTGGAVAAAFHRRPWVDVVLLYPDGLVSPRQAQQLACWGGNVRTFAVQGTFDDCQRVVKEAFQDRALSAALGLSSANSINIGRLLPQMVYYAATSLEVWHREGRKANFVVPSGNLGNVTAGVWARELGLPIGDIVLATNANPAVTEFLDGGAWRPRASVATLASAMDVGNPSNMERLRTLFPDRLATRVSARLVTDEQIRATIRQDAEALDYVWDPHGATAAHVYHHALADRTDEPWVLLATAHPAKFNEIVEPLIGRAIAVPPALARLLSLPRQEERLAPTLDALRARL